MFLELTGSVLLYSGITSYLPEIVTGQVSDTTCKSEVIPITSDYCSNMIWKNEFIYSYRVHIHHELINSLKL